MDELDLKTFEKRIRLRQLTPDDFDDVVFMPSDIPFARCGVATETSPNLETVLVHDLDTELLRRARMRGTVQNWNDRRTGLYRVVWKGDDEPHEV